MHFPLRMVMPRNLLLLRNFSSKADFFLRWQEPDNVQAYHASAATGVTIISSVTVISGMLIYSFVLMYALFT